jgi:hypothetical protein
LRGVVGVRDNNKSNFCEERRKKENVKFRSDKDDGEDGS